MDLALRHRSDGRPVFHGIWTDNVTSARPGTVCRRLHDPNPPDSLGRRRADRSRPNRPALSAWTGRDAEAGHLHRADHARSRRRRSGRLAHPDPSLQRRFPSSRKTTARLPGPIVDDGAAGGWRTWLVRRFEQHATLDVRVPARWTVARTVFARQADATAPRGWIVDVVRVSAPETAPRSPMARRRTIVLESQSDDPRARETGARNPGTRTPGARKHRFARDLFDKATPTVRKYTVARGCPARKCWTRECES